MTHHRDSLALLDIYNAARKVQAFSGGFDRKAFFADDRTQ